MKRNPKRFLNIFVWVYFFSIILETTLQLKFSGTKILLPEFVFLLSIPFILFYLFHRRQKLWNIIKTDKIVFALGLYSFLVFINWIKCSNAAGFGELLGSFYVIGLVLSISILGDIDLPKIIVKVFVNTGIFCSVFIVLGLGLHLIGITDKLVEYYPDYIYLGDVWRSKAWFRTPIMTADFLCLALLLGLFLFEKKQLQSPYLTLGFISIGLLLTLVKSSLILAGILLIYFSAKFRYRILTKLIGGAFILLYLVMSHVVFQKTDAIISSNILSKDYISGSFYEIPYVGYSTIPTAYTTIKYASLRAGFTHFPLGIGGNNQIEYHRKLHTEGILKKEFNLAPHSTYFGAFGELGIFGLLCILLLYYWVYKIIAKLFHDHRVDTMTRDYGHMILGFMMLSGVTMDNMNIRHYWVLIAILPLWSFLYTSDKLDTAKTNRLMYV